jgi:DNA-binding response OmpR family regulator
MRDPARILVVDDVPDNLDILQVRLESQGYEVATAGDGVEALKKVRGLLSDLVLLDIMMPKMNGIEAVRKLKAHTSLPFIPVILVTAKSDSKDVIAGLESGGDDYLTKPIDHAALLARVRSMLRIKALHDTVQLQAERLEQQSAELAAWNKALEERVATQVGEIERISRLKQFLAPQIAESIVSSGGEAILESHRRDIVVLFCDMRGFTAFSETAEPKT